MAEEKKTRGTRARKPAGDGEPGAAPVTESAARAAMQTVAQQLRSWADTMVGLAGTAADVSLAFAKSSFREPAARAAVEKTGHMLRRLRETAGMSAKQLGEAIDLKDPTLIELAENGKVALPFEIILRLAGVLARNDPVSFVMNLTRSYNPELWRALDSLGVGRVLVHAGREREFVNIYRGHDAARELSDGEFAAVLGFVNQALELALAFHAAEKAKAKTGASRKPGAA
ncbi:MAG TPA: helix-turn-helix transcriptional regulator [Rhodocyclaceae bacterium]|nr:helix-turn-helix transcriptional regulator [Rhodocyclaceae bacterium]